MKKALFIINPSSGRQNFLNMVEGLAGKLVMQQLVSHIDVVYTKKQEDAKNAAAQIKEGQYDFVTAIGGDGTLNEVINGVILSGTRTPIAVISAGTVNDFASYLNLPQNVDGFCEMIRDFHCKSVDVGKVNDKYFVNVLAGGLLTDVGYKVTKELKAIMGKMAYYVEGAKDLPKNLFNTVTLGFESEEYTKDVEALLFIVANSRSVGGFKNMASLASVSDGLLDVLVLRKVEFPNITNLLIKILQGDHINHPSVDYFQTKALKIRNLDEENPVIVDYDGECFGQLPVEVEVIPDAIEILVPKNKKKEISKRTRKESL